MGTLARVDFSSRPVDPRAAATTGEEHVKLSHVDAEKLLVVRIARCRARGAREDARGDAENGCRCEGGILHIFRGDGRPDAGGGDADTAVSRTQDTVHMRGVFAAAKGVR